jgi:hypothetical protein
MPITKEALAKEILSRGPDTKRDYTTPGFYKQNAFVEDIDRFIAACTTRRAGKSTGLGLRFLRSMEKYPKSQSLYLAMTQESAKQIMWPVLQELDETYKIGLRFAESSLTVSHPNGSKLRLMGADLANFVKRLRGRKFVGVAIDEGQDFGSHLQSLVDDVLTPSIADYTDGWLALTGTPGPVPQGYFFEVTQNNRFGYKNHKWSLVDNPFMPNPAEFIEELKSKREWADDNPTLRREWRGEWVLDPASLWIRYHDNVNHYEALPNCKWNYILGVDIGFKDADAIAVIAWSNECRETYLVEEDITKKQTISSLVTKVDALQKKYNAYKIVLDEGGLGKKIGEDIRTRFGCPLEPADKAHKQDNVEFLNDDLRLGRFKAKKDSRFALDSYLVQIDWDKTRPNKIVIKKEPHSDIIDAVLYAFRESYSFTHKPEKPKPAYGTREWAEAQHDEMWQKELEGFQKQSSSPENLMWGPTEKDWKID